MSQGRQLIYCKLGCLERTTQHTPVQIYDYIIIALRDLLQPCQLLLAYLQDLSTAGQSEIV